MRRFWSVTAIVPAIPNVTNGHASTREESMVKFRSAWEIRRHDRQQTTGRTLRDFVDGTPRTYRDEKPMAIEAAELLKRSIRTAPSRRELADWREDRGRV
jgi:hypothetical protein